MDKYTEWQIKRLQPLIGGRIIGTLYSPSDQFGDEFFGLKVQAGNKEYAFFILADDEGNGPGSFELTELVP